ncbi:MAG: Cell cycle protein GpsB [Firmicutes bacterium ADurb.Bin248]|jgi:cell division initiation protein|nr:MAG: Cell cycle protein GpsB [Firmicutes bacterium ADurb.Bin248]HOF99532.1 DivIVA domain-containing protein [Clostridia bacterium]HPK15197.1 DivIVA domain-containing protein [Clostridia bacterium]
MDKEKIVNKRFRRSFLGYDIEEVDAFLDDIIREFDRRDQEAGVARLRIRMLLEELACRGPIRQPSGEPEPEKARPEEAHGGPEPDE